MEIKFGSTEYHNSELKAIAEAAFDCTFNATTPCSEANACLSQVANLTPQSLANYLGVSKMNIVYDHDCSNVTDFWTQALSAGVNESIFNAPTEDMYAHCNPEVAAADSGDIKPQCFFYSPESSCSSPVTFSQLDCYTVLDVLTIIAEINGGEDITEEVVQSMVEALNDYENGVSVLYDYR